MAWLNAVNKHATDSEHNNHLMRLDTSHAARSMLSIPWMETTMLTALFIVAFLPLAIMVGLVVLAGFLSALFK